MFDCEKVVYDVVGFICEMFDFLGKGRELVIVEGDFIVMCLVGVYGVIMFFIYNFCL